MKLFKKKGRKENNEPLVEGQDKESSDQSLEMESHEGVVATNDTAADGHDTSTKVNSDEVAVDGEEETRRKGFFSRFRKSKSENIEKNSSEREKNSDQPEQRLSSSLLLYGECNLDRIRHQAHLN